MICKNLYKDVIQYDKFDQHQSYPSSIKMKELRKELKEILVISECGKGKGIMHLCCPIVWSKHTDTNLYSDEDHFKKENLTPNQVLAIFRNKYKTGGWDRITSLCKKANVPYLYLVPKLKDVNKLRPLASYFRHPLKKVYK